MDSISSSSAHSSTMDGSRQSESPLRLENGINSLLHKEGELEEQEEVVYAVPDKIFKVFFIFSMILLYLYHCYII